MTNGRLVKWPIGAKQGVGDTVMGDHSQQAVSGIRPDCAGEILLQESNNRQQLCVETFAVGRDGTCYLMDPEKCGAPTDWGSCFLDSFLDIWSEMPSKEVGGFLLGSTVVPFLHPSFPSQAMVPFCSKGASGV